MGIVKSEILDMHTRLGGSQADREKSLGIILFEVREAVQIVLEDATKWFTHQEKTKEHHKNQ